MFYIIMGVSGSGKSSVGKLLSQHSGWQFYDADDFHSPEAIAKMSRGIPLADSDRQLWLKRLNNLVETTLNAQENAILACSALKSEYRQIIEGDRFLVTWIYLQGDYDCLLSRLQQRQGHYFPANLLRSQFDILEEPQTAITIDVSLLTQEAIVQEILARIPTDI